MKFIKTTDPSQVSSLKAQWLKTLTAPQDGMWEALTNQAIHWEINTGDKSIGYACVTEDNRLLQFYLVPDDLHDGIDIFKDFIHQQKITSALIGTNNPTCLSIALHVQKSVVVDTYLFTDFLEVNLIAHDGKLRMAMNEDLSPLVDFCHLSMGAPKEWLAGYLQNLIDRNEIYIFEKGEEILGTCEVRKSDSNIAIADIGMVVSPNHRRKGLGTFLLGKAKEIALQSNRQPICSCEKGNVASYKSIHKNGFRSIHRMLLLEF